jgi:hypothetical protein
MESPVISLNLPVLPGSSVSFPHLPTINTLPHIHFRFVSTIPTFSLSRRTFFYSSCISQSSNRICLNFTVSSTDLLIFIRMSHFRFSCTFPGVHLFAGTFLYLLQISLYLHIFLYILYLPRISLFLS